MPVEIDPFTTPPEEKRDYLDALSAYVISYGREISSLPWMMQFIRQERAVATSDGAYCTQTTYQAEVAFAISVRLYGDVENSVIVPARHLGRAAKGWELVLDADIIKQIPVMREEGIALLRSPILWPEIGRYDVVFDAKTTAGLVDQTIGMATELDRVVGLEANAIGTSYLGPDPLASLGVFNYGTPLLTISADRAAPEALGTVKWDDEAVSPQPYALVERGVVSNFQTTREQAAWIAPWYQQKNLPIQSNGCAGAASALDITMQRSPNLIMKPGAEVLSFEDMVANTRKGYAIIGAQVTVDHQSRNGASLPKSGRMFEIVNGKLKGWVRESGGILFSTNELWKNVTNIGGSGSVEWSGHKRVKGQPEQTLYHSVAAVPMTVKNVAVIDVTRRA